MMSVLSKILIMSVTLHYLAHVLMFDYHVILHVQMQDWYL